ncbi:hypothetical protein [Desulfovibrio litoralis]|uniref:Uncharacterized protein n=1 Tax=Desulfovibrio litoralis DSM 11393 TaxID=1121455 RepID=A0A1M7TKD6_9BACT|nr:hypothetical protein [Desulfovibrio litoralis]SHN71199.1 hypothetical protein SAMN02745728_02161 [Desulfovibrio litoralis DSM 11393]
MERMLLKMAAQLNSLDEASLMNLWQELAEKVEDFEPTKRWEEQALALGMIQALHMKNQLFNYNLATLHRKDKDMAEDVNFLAGFDRKNTKQKDSESSESNDKEPLVQCKVLQFRPRD